MFLDFLDECEGMLRCLMNTVYLVSDAMNQQCTHIHAYNLIIYSFLFKALVHTQPSIKLHIYLTSKTHRTVIITVPPRLYCLT